MPLTSHEKKFYEALFAYSQERVQQFLKRITAMQNLLRQMEGSVCFSFLFLFASFFSVFEIMTNVYYVRELEV